MLKFFVRLERYFQQSSVVVVEAEDQDDLIKRMREVCKAATRKEFEVESWEDGYYWVDVGGSVLLGPAPDEAPAVFSLESGQRIDRRAEVDNEENTRKSNEQGHSHG